MASPQAEANAQIRILQAQDQLAQQQQTRQQALDDAKKARDDATFQSALGTSYSQAQQDAQNRITSKGLNYADFAPDVTNALDQARHSVPNDDPNPGSYFGGDLVDNVLNDVRNQRRTTYGQEVKQQVAPTGFDTNAIGNDFDKSTLDAIYGSQYTDANDQVNRAIARGNLSPVGATTAENELASQGAAGRSKLNDLGNGVLSGYRQQLSDIGTKASDAASGYDFGDSFDPSYYKGLINDKVGQFSNSVDSDVRNATAGTNIFDVGSIIGKAGQSQGLYNPSTADQVGSSPIFSTLQARGDLRRKQRGLDAPDTGAAF